MSLGGAIGCYGTQAVRLEVWGQAGVAASPLALGLFRSLTLYRPGPVFTQNATGAPVPGSWGLARLAVPVLPREGALGRLALQDAGDVVQEVGEERRDALVT